MHYVETAYGQPFSVKRRVSEAHLLDSLSLHALRKADRVRMAESATEKETAAKPVHTDCPSAPVYTKGANQERLAVAAFRRVIEQSAGECGPLKLAWGHFQKTKEQD
jgi:hypothetical protein